MEKWFIVDKKAYNLKTSESEENGFYQNDL